MNPEFAKLLWSTRTGPAVIAIGRAWFSTLWNPEEATEAEQRFVVGRVKDALADADDEVELE